MSKTDEDSVSHTPEPWVNRNNYTDAVGREHIYICGQHKTSGPALTVCLVSGQMVGADVQKANARRICAAVNACVGLETETLEAWPDQGGITGWAARSGTLAAKANARADAAGASKIELAEHLDKTIAVAADAVNRADAAEARLQRIAGILNDANERCMAGDGEVTLPLVEELTMADISKIYEAAALDRPVVDPLLEEARGALEVFMCAMDMSLSHEHEKAICDAYDKASALLPKLDEALK